MSNAFNSTAARKAAILVSSLDTEAADKLLDHLPPEMAEAVRALTLSVDDISAAERDAVIREFFSSGSRRVESPAAEEAANNAGAKRTQPVDPHADDGVELRLSSAGAAELAAPEKLSAVQQQPIEQPQNRTRFDFLHGAEAASLSSVLQGEHPQTIAVIVAHLRRDRAGQLLAALPTGLREEVIRRILHLGEMHPEILREVEEALATRFSYLGLSSANSTHGQTVLREILEAATPDTRRKLDSGMRTAAAIAPAADPDETIEFRPARHGLPRPQMSSGRTQPMSFADVQRLTGDALFSVFTVVSPEEAILALFDAAEPFVERVLGQLSPREARVWRYALAHPGPTRLADVEAAQARIAAAADELVMQGQIHPPFQQMALVA